MISLFKFAPLVCLICLKTINLTSARLAPNEKFSLDSVATSDAIRKRSTSPPSENLVPIGILWGGATGDQFGHSVSLSYNGDALAVGSPWHDEGIVHVFQQGNASQWNKAWNVTGENKDDLFGYSMSLSGDAKRIAVGTNLWDNGYAKLFEIETGKVTAIVGDKSDTRFGQSVSVSHDANRVAVSAFDYARVFQVREDGNLDKIGDDILTYDDWSTVALSVNGGILAIGESSHDNYKGRVRIFEWNSNEWKQLGGDMVGEDEYGDFGNSLDLAADGHRVIIGARVGNYAKVYDYDGSDWEVVGGKLSGESNDKLKFGYSVSISNNGSRIVIGSPSFESGLLWRKLRRRGRAVVYQYENGVWNQIGHDILGDKAYDTAGSSVAISGDGNIVSIGAPDGDSDRGYVMIYEVN